LNTRPKKVLNNSYRRDAKDAEKNKKIYIDYLRPITHHQIILTRRHGEHREKKGINHETHEKIVIASLTFYSTCAK